MVEFLENLNWITVSQIIMVDVLLGGDNAVVIALACRNLPSERRMQGILWGTGGAIALRVVLIAFALSLLTLPFVKLIGGVLLLWIGIKLMVPQDGNDHIQGSSSLLSAIKTIILADFVMSLDNVVAIAAAAQGAHADHQVILVVFGLLVSVPIIIWGSTLLLRLLDRFPIIVTLGAGLLGWIAGGMLVSDAFVVRYFGELDGLAKAVVEAAGAIVVIGVGYWLAGSKRTSVSGTEEGESA
ncbi:TerC family protein [Pollutimonas harenae]|uniref:TerC family protein n=1 Tax=Pollutimonas harenae TaxID=657015 RepID=A0A853GVS7_9BURK|nr:TerC family protein [Pollutimonas harenae]NYT84876.1 TerC family protein [Pollutimonas harenae]TEA72726.1 TerC family protein [Pollutimonas harenae]